MPGRKPKEQPPRAEFGEGLGRAIRLLRTARDLSRKALAERAGLSYSYLSEVEQGAKVPSSRALAAIADGLGMPVHQLLETTHTWRTPASGEAGELTRRIVGLRTLNQLEASRSRDAFASFADEEGPPPIAESVLELRADPDLPGLPLEPPTEVPEPLLAEIDAGNCVAFVGAGFSAAAGLPGWGELLDQIARRPGVPKATRAHVSKRVAHGSAYALDEAAQVLEDHLGRERFLEQLEAALGRPDLVGTMALRVSRLHGIPFRSILTTNFDGVLRGATPSHEAFRRALRPHDHRWWSPRYWGEAEGAFTLKLHGDLAQPPETPPDTIVLTRRDYRRRLYEDPAYETFLRAIMATTTVLYMGFSFEDAYLNELRSEILALLGQRSESAPVAYAIVNDVPPDTRRHFRLHEGIEILSYDTQGGRDFGGFDAYLRGIHAATNPLLRFARHLEQKRILWLDPHPENNALAFTHLDEAARVAGREGTALVTVATAEEAHRELERAAAGDTPYDLVITHWGEAPSRWRRRGSDPTAVQLLTGMRSRDLRCPVVVFAADQDAEARKRTALGLGAQAYCFSFETLYRTLDEVLAPGEETG